MNKLRPGSLLMVCWGERAGTGVRVSEREFIIVGHIYIDENNDERFSGFSSTKGRRDGWTEIVYSSVNNPPLDPALGWKVLVW